MEQRFSSEIRQNGCIPWDPAHMAVGRGFDSGTRETVAAPFYSIDDDNDGESDVPSRFEVQTRVFREQKSLADYLDGVDRSQSYLAPANMVAMATQLGSLCCDANNMVLILRCTITTEASHFYDDLVLTKEARKILDEDVTAFTKCYGEYCVTGYIRQSAFCAIISYNSESIAEMDHFASTMDSADRAGSSPDEASTVLLGRASSHTASIKQSQKLIIDGCEGGADLIWLEDDNLEDAWHGFKSEYKPVPHVALLNHYSSLLVNEIPRPTSYANVTDKTADAIVRCSVLQMLYRSQSAKHEGMLTRLDKLRSELEALRGSYSFPSITRVDYIRSELDHLKVDLTRSTTLRAELSKIANDESSQYAESKWSHAPYNTCGEDTWEMGLTPAKLQQLGINTQAFSAHTKTCILPDSDRMVTQKPEPVRHQLPGRAIIGALLRNRYADPRHGGKWSRTGGWLGRDSFGIKVETQHFRGCSWELTVWSVSEGIFDREIQA